MKAMMIAVALAFLMVAVPKPVDADEQPSPVGLATEVCDAPVKIAGGIGMTEKTTIANPPQPGILTGGLYVPDTRTTGGGIPGVSVTWTDRYNPATGIHDPFQRNIRIGGEFAGFAFQRDYGDRFNGLAGVAMGCRAEVEKFIENRSKEK